MKCLMLSYKMPNFAEGTALYESWIKNEGLKILLGFEGVEEFRGFRCLESTIDKVVTMLFFDTIHNVLQAVGDPRWGNVIATLSACGITNTEMVILDTSPLFPTAVFPQAAEDSPA